MKSIESVVSNWLQSACSDVSVRECLLKPWSDGKHLIATDGHRMHLQKTDLPSFGDRFPKVDPILNQRADARIFCEIIADKAIVKRLRAIAKLLRELGSQPIVSFAVNTAGAVTASADLGLSKIEILLCGASAPVGEIRNVDINAEYLADALQLGADCYKHGCKVEIHYGVALSPVFFEYGNGCSAVVMPCTDKADRQTDNDRKAKKLRAEMSKGIQPQP